MLEIASAIFFFGGGQNIIMIMGYLPFLWKFNHVYLGAYATTVFSWLEPILKQTKSCVGVPGNKKTAINRL